MEWIFFSDVADYELFGVHDPLSDEKSNLKMSCVNKTFQKKPEHFCSPHVYITNEIFFCQRLVLCKKNTNTNLVVNIQCNIDQ